MFELGLEFFLVVFNVGAGFFVVEGFDSLSECLWGCDVVVEVGGFEEIFDFWAIAEGEKRNAVIERADNRMEAHRDEDFSFGKVCVVYFGQVGDFGLERAVFVRLKWEKVRIW